MSLNWNLVLIIVIIVLIIGGGIALYFALNAPPEANLANLGDKCTSHTDCKNWGPGARNAACCTDPQGGGVEKHVKINLMVGVGTKHL